MKKIILPATILLLMTTEAAVVQSAPKSRVIPNNPSKIIYDSLDWTVPLGEPYRNELKNGCVVYIAEDSQLPLVKITAYIRDGSLADPPGKEGLTSLMAKMLRSGGTKKFPADTLDDLIGLLALRMGFSAHESQLTFKGSFLTEYSDNAFTILEELFFHPVFDAKKLEKERKIVLESIRHRFDNPGPTLGIAFEKSMYPGQPPGRLSTESSIKSITRKDLVDLHRSLFYPGNIIFCIAGKFNRDTMKTRLEKLFSTTAASGRTTVFPKVSVNRTPVCLLVHKAISQAYVRLGLPLFQRPHPDYYSMSVLNLILGGDGFTSRLGKKIRSDAGLTYSIHSEAQSNYVYPATFYINFFTKNASFAQAVELSLKEVRLFVENGVSEEELTNAKSSLIDELPSMFRSPDDIVATYGWNEYYHRAPDHFKVYPEKIRAITREDIARVARKYLNVDSMSITVVGDTTQLIRLKSGEFSLANFPRNTILPDAIPRLP